jgi:PAS domain S-box-containing protein
MQAALHDEVAERKRAQDMLHEYKERYRLATEATRCGTWDWNARTGVLQCSGEAIRLLGLSTADFSGPIEDLAGVLHADDHPRICALVKKLLHDQGTEFSDEFRLLSPDGSVLWVAGRGRVFYDDAGTPLRMVGVCTDVTERKLLDESLRDAARRKDEFLAILAHELRNPLNAIGNAVKLLHTHGSAGPDHEWGREVIERQVEHLTRLISDLLDVSRITRNKLELRKERVDLTEIIRGAVDGSRPLFDRGKHEVTVTLPASQVWVNGDRIRLAQLLMNLLDNAAKYTPVGGRIWLTAELDSGKPQGSHEAVVRVSDTGVGIAPEKLPELFDMFYQVDVSLERSQGGLGIGLTLVRQLIAMHGGTVEAFSKGVGQGSEFVVRVPVLAENEIELDASLIGDDPKSVPAGRRILVADDNRDSAESMARVLRSLVNEVETVYSGIDAVEAAQNFRPDIILLDIGMPIMNGYEAAKTIRQQPWGKNAVLIALTGWGQEEDRRRSREAGFDAHLIKPVDHTALMKLLAGLPTAPPA